MINIISLNDLCKGSSQNLGSEDEQICKQMKFAKIIDWSGMTAQQRSVLRDMSFGFDKNDTLYISTLNELHAVSLKGIEFSDQIIDDLTDSTDVSDRPTAKLDLRTCQNLRLRMLFDEPQRFE